MLPLKPRWPGRRPRPRDEVAAGCWAPGTSGLPALVALSLLRALPYRSLALVAAALCVAALPSGPAAAQGDTQARQVCDAVSAQPARNTFWRQGEYFRGEGFTEAWTNAAYGHAGGGCLQHGIPIPRSGRLLVCGYYDGGSDTSNQYGPQHCSNASRPASRTTLAQPTTVGAVHMHNGRAAAQWAEILVQENSNGRLDGGPCTSPSLRIATVPETVGL